MVMSIENSLITEFSDMVHHEAQQTESLLNPYVITKQMSGDVFAYDGLGPVEARELVGRVVPVTFDDITHNRRKIARRRFAVTLPIDSSDVRGALLDVNGEYAKACAAAMMRKRDKVIADAAFADVLTGRDFSTTVTFANDGGLTIDATAGLTYERLLEIDENFIDNAVGFDPANSKKFLTLTGGEHTDLMGEIELVSGDYTRQFAVEKGQLTNAMGYDLVKFPANAPFPILTVSGAERFLIAATQKAFCVGVSKEMSVKVTERNDYHEVTQVEVIMEIGAVRTEGALVQKVRVTA